MRDGVEKRERHFTTKVAFSQSKGVAVLKGAVAPGGGAESSGYAGVGGGGWGWGALSGRGRGSSGRVDKAPSLPWRLPPSCGHTGYSADTRTEWGLRDGAVHRPRVTRPSLLTPPLPGPEVARWRGGLPRTQTSWTQPMAGAGLAPPIIRRTGARRPGTGTRLETSSASWGPVSPQGAHTQ